MTDGSRSSSAGATSSWVSVAVPSAADLIFIALLAVLLFTPLTVKFLEDAGIGWHIRTGQQITATHHVPRVDSFSSTMAGRPWFAWEWLYDVAVGWMDAAFGLNGVVWLTVLIISSVFAWMFRWLVAQGANLLVGLTLVLLALSASMVHFLARPHVVSWLLTLVWFQVLDASERESLTGQIVSKRRLWTLPPMMLVWANIHGGFLLGFVLLGIFWLAATWNWFTANENRIEEALQKIAAGKRARDLLWVGLLSVICSLVNPYGWALYTHIYRYLTNRFLMSHIDEFQSPNFHGAAQRCFLALLLISVAVLWRMGRELRVSAGLTVLFAVYAGLFASRNIPMSSILLAMVAGPAVATPRFVKGFLERTRDTELGLKGHLWPALAVVATLAVVANGGRAGSRVLMDAHFDSGRMPVEAVNFLEQYNIKGPALSPDFWGGYLIYRLYPKTRVVVDDRHDLYGEEFFRSYLKLVHLEDGWDDFLRENKAGFLVLPREAPLTNILLVTPGWKSIHRDGVAIVFVGNVPNR